jgi:integrase
MPRQRLTLPRIAAFNPTSEGFLWDEGMPRLAVRARATGAKSFVFKGTLNYRDIRITIGGTDAWTIEAAREEARRFQRLIDAGQDPRDVLRQQEAERAAEGTARIAAADAAKVDAERKAAPAMAAWRAYVQARRPKWGELSARDHDRVSKEGGEPITRGRRTTEDGKTQPGALRPLLLLPLTQIDAERVRAWLSAEAAKRPAHAALAFRLLRGFLNWCADQPEFADQVQPKACSSKKVREELPKRQAKDDCLQREQLGLWFEHIGKLPNPVHSAYLQALLLTGARPGELVGIRWRDADFQWRALTIRDKIEGERAIPLTPYVASLLAALPRRNEWIFSSPTSADGRLAEPRIGHVKALAAAGLPSLTLHGLRRSFGTLSEWVECPTGVSAQIMGHKPSAIAEKHYRVRPLDLLRQWHTKIEGWILEQAGIEQPREDAQGLRMVKA